MKNIKITLTEKDMRKQWSNMAADLPTPMQPPLGPDGKPISPEMLEKVFARLGADAELAWKQVMQALAAPPEA